MGEDGEGPRYRAFISYSHRDAAFGRRLHRRLEGYAMPRRLLGRPTVAGPVPARLAPIFRDREELPAAHDLTAEVRAALAASRSLIVVCSPAAAVSPWVAREVELFRELHPDRPILAALVEGDPAQAFPPPLRQDQSVEPLAADFRSGRDGERLALLKLIAGIVAVGLDQLVQRDAQRRLRRVTAVTGAAVAAMLAMGVLTAFALSARAEADRQRAEAEGMVEFMLTDLRDRLKGVGRLDIMSAVNERARRYYRSQDTRKLPPASLEQRARILHAMGEDDEARGDHDAALKKFNEAYRATAELLRKAPDDPERIFTHAQSVYWLGYVDYQRGRSTTAMPAFRAYKRLADRLVSIAPKEIRYLKEASYADGNLCAMAFEKPSNPRAALRLCQAALDRMQQAAALDRSAQAQQDLINRHAWLANAFEVNGNIADAWRQRQLEERLLKEQISADPSNVDLKDTWISLQLALAELEIKQGIFPRARERLHGAQSAAEALAHLDHANARWASQVMKTRRLMMLAREKRHGPH